MTKDNLCSYCGEGQGARYVCVFCYEELDLEVGILKKRITALEKKNNPFIKLPKSVLKH